jgi:L-alanine-DL-glutamate epimerase-like enolase superfamily enzyme
VRVYITARRPSEVAVDVERWRQRGCRSFVLRRVTGGGELDRERLGAARYAAGLQAEVELEGDASDLSDAASR